jgi:hypothetical protein
MPADFRFEESLKFQVRKPGFKRIQNEFHLNTDCPLPEWEKDPRRGFISHHLLRKLSLKGFDPRASCKGMRGETRNFLTETSRSMPLQAVAQGLAVLNIPLYREHP